MTTEAPAIVEPFKACPREDCRIEDRGMTSTLAHTFSVTDKFGRAIDPGPNTTRHHKRCQTCGVSWCIERTGASEKIVIQER